MQGDDPRARQGLQEEKASSAPPQAPDFVFFYFLSSKCSSGLFVSFLLIVALAVAYVGAENSARNRGSAQMCVNVALRVLHVLLLTVLGCDAANYCALLG